MAPNTILSMVASAVSIGVSVLLELALLLVAIVLVRKYRKDAWGWFAAASVVQLLGTLLGSLGWGMASAIVTHTSGVDAMVRFNAVMTLGRTLFTATGALLLIVGIMQLARPASGSSSPGGPFSNLGA